MSREVYGISEIECPICGKTFIKPWKSSYKVYMKGKQKTDLKECCSWHCFRKATLEMGCRSFMARDYA